jgi:Fur family ferric uptake transcriptional regulator
MLIVIFCDALVKLRSHPFPRYSGRLQWQHDQHLRRGPKRSSPVASLCVKQDLAGRVRKRAKRADAPSLDDVRRSIRDKGLRSTPARLAILRRLFGAGQPMTHAQVADELAPLGFDRATIYRNLVELADVGLLHRLELGDHVWRFELRQSADQGKGDHTHFLCVDCGDVSCVPDLSLQAAVSLVGHRASPGRVTEVLLKGHCKRCQ